MTLMRISATIHAIFCKNNEMMISAQGTNSTRHFWSRLLLSMIAIFALPTAQGLETAPNAENYTSSISIQQVWETAKVAREVQQQQRFQPVFISYFNEKTAAIQPHFAAQVLNLRAPIRAGPASI